jgi:hypothetical protein
VLATLVAVAVAVSVLRLRTRRTLLQELWRFCTEASL